jgi:thiol-disulfide isomerase/thioredoxin
MNWRNFETHKMGEMDQPANATSAARSRSKGRRLLPSFSVPVVGVLLVVAAIGMAFVIDHRQRRGPNVDGSTRLPAETNTSLLDKAYLRNDRYILFKPERPWHISEVTAPGYYTLIALSASWCAPCKPLRNRLHSLSEQVDNLVVIDVDVSAAKSMSHFSVQPFGATTETLGMPAVFLFDPYGLYINSQKDADTVGAPIAGYENIVDKLRFFETRSRRDIVVELKSSARMEALSRIKETSNHYAK